MSEQIRHPLFIHKKLEAFHLKTCFHTKHNDCLLMNTVELITYTDLKCGCTPKKFSPKYTSSLPKQSAIFNNDDVTLVAYF